MGDQALLQEHGDISDKMSAYDFRDACEAGDFDKAKGLITSVDINETDEYGFTGLHMASENGHLKIVEELVAAGRSWSPWSLTATCSLCTWPSTRTPLQLPDCRLRRAQSSTKSP